MSASKKIIGVMLSENQARIAVVEPRASKGLVTALAQVGLPPRCAWADRLAGVEAELKALGCDRRTMVWVACSLPEMQFANLSVEKMERKHLGPVAWMKFRKEVEKLSVKVIFDYEVQEANLGGVTSLLNLTAFATPYDEVEQLKQWFDARFDLLGITMDLFADRNLISMSSDPAETVVLLSCDEHLSRIMVIRGGRTMFTRTIKAGTGLLQDFAEKKLNRPVIASELKAVLKPSMLNNSTLLTPEQQALQQACSDGISRLFTQVSRAIDYYTEHLKHERPTKLLLTGNTDVLLHAMPELANRLGVELKLLDPQARNMQYSADVTDLFKDGGAEHYSSAIGVAMGREGRTPNLICTNDVKERLLKVKRLRGMVATVFVVLAALLAGGLFWQMNVIRKQEKQLGPLEERYTAMAPLLTMDEASTQLMDLQLDHKNTLLLVQRNRMTAALGEVIELTPPEFRIKTVTLDHEGTASFVLEGVVMEKISDSESYLAKYVVDLNGSSFLTQVSLISDFSSKEIWEMRRKGILPFTISGNYVNGEEELEK